MSKEITKFGQNLRFLRLQHKPKLSQTDLGTALSTADDNVSRSAISSYEDGRAEPNYKRLEKISNFFDIPIDQILTQELDKLDKLNILKKENVSDHTSGKDLRILAIPMDKDKDEENIVFIPEKARAGYASGYSDIGFFKNLPKYTLPFLPKGKTYRAFEISGDSMPPLNEGTIIIGEYIDDWNDIKEGTVCIVTTRNDGFVLKKVYNNITNNNSFILKSTNLRYSPYEVDVHDVREVWRLVAHISKEFPDNEEANSLTEMQEAIWRLDQEVLNMKRKN
ncbi:XRE family transcriptional regulator [Flammeovirga kamogawensis]|uniref:LexA family transcriptional regulator n=1 Tax=Flammeovirga kamogawensis TaxID=373891 RepID=A0ABX8GXI9_9BACT|nr:LexA family transcriptional regulator [Flammeovirga kamogawensis]MBB6460557.1 transcriptional regulator with XRE-family HTH domain [Flammeovirga kamogawensis]QWG07917.1 LexA family transcriptional regulator [Flammeovirga kamogawensis]TRX69724.1 LexA family transcriptional regulator [Flammeovirga kamogawensis]